MPPRPPRPRAALLEIADRLPDTALCVVVAQAGSGKSVLVRSWRDALRAAGRLTALLDVSDLHADAASFAAAWAESLDSVSPGSFSASIRTAAQVQDSDRGWVVLARALLRDLSAEGPPIVSILDGTEALPKGSSAESLLDEVLRAAPPRLRVVIASRGAVPGSAARRRMEGSLLEIGADDLSLRGDQVSRALQDAGVPDDPALVAGILAQTEGWATGVVLAARLLADATPSDRHHVVSDLARRPDLIAYFSEEVLRRERPASLAVLEASALLGEASAEEIAEAAGSTAALAAVREAAERGLLQDEGGERLRVPSLWRVFLRQGMRARLGDDASLAVRRRAAAILARRRQLEEAIALLIEAGDFEAGAALLARAGRALLGTGRRGLVLDWLGRIPAEIRETSPELTAQHGLALMGSDPDRAASLLEKAARAFRARGDEADEHATWGALAFVHLSEGRMDAFRRLARERLSIPRLVVDRAQRGALLVGLAGRANLARRFQRSLRLSEEAARHPLPVVSRWMNATNRILIHSLRGEFARAHGLAEEALRDADLVRFVLPFQSLRVQRALAGAARGDAREKAEALAEARDAVATLRDLGLDRTRMAATLVLGQVASAAGDLEGAVAAHREAAELAARAGNRPFEAAARAVLASASLLAGDEPGARAAAFASCAAYERLLSEGAAVMPWLFARALWTRARTGEAQEAWVSARRHERRIARLDAPMLAHTTGLLLADVARLAGRTKEAERLACDAWRLSAESGLAVGDFEIGADLELATAPLALARGVATDHLIDRLRSSRPKALEDLLRTLLRDGAAGLRREIAAQMGRLGDRVFHDALATAAQEDADPKARRAAAEALARLELRPRHALRFETFGRFRAFRGDEEIPEREWRGVTSRRLLFRLLVAEGRPVPRDVLLEDLWPDTDPELARNSLRVAASRLHDVLEPDRPEGVPPHFVQAEGDALCVPAEARIVWDARLWEEALDGSRPDRDGERRVALFHEFALPLLPDLGPDRWLEGMRQRLAGRFASLVHALAGEALVQGDLDACEGYLAKLLEHDEADERAWALRMRVRLRRGERAGALRVFRQASESLRRSVDAVPGEELEGLAREARNAHPERS